MKYIKLFEGFDQDDSMEKIKQDINDIFIELIDVGYEVDVKIHPSVLIDSLQVDIVGENDWFFFDKIYENILMLIDYVESEFDDVKVIYDYEEYNESSYMMSREWKQKVMERLFSSNNETENKHFLVSYFSVEFETVNKKL